MFGDAMTNAVSLEDRPAGYEVARQCITVQQRAAKPTALGRFFGVSPVPTEAASWYTGTLGEMRVGALLRGLSSEWTVLHSIPIGTRGSDIDHVVIGPGGVFTINTKRHRAKQIWLGEHRLLVSGHKTDHLRNARSEAERASLLLGRALGTHVKVVPMVVLVAIGQMTIRQRPVDVAVLRDSQLVRWLRKRKRVLLPEQVDSISRAARDSRSWQLGAVPPVDRAYLAGFELLRQMEERALSIRRVWIIAGGAAAIIAALNILPVFLHSLLG